MLKGKRVKVTFWVDVPMRYPSDLKSDDDDLNDMYVEDAVDIILGGHWAMRDGEVIDSIH